AFGMDVKTYRAFKGMTGRATNLRDQMTELELALTTLAETTAAALHRNRGSTGTPNLLNDIHETGQIVSGLIHDLEQRTGLKVARTNAVVPAADNTRQTTAAAPPAKVA